jgi:hypothetical protein
MANRTDCAIAGVIRDTLYIDGGYQWWLPGLKDESYGAPINDGKISEPIV